MSTQMYELPYQDAQKYCGKCNLLKYAIQKRDINELDMNTLGRLREQCAQCRTFGTGIYKADAIMGAMSAFPSRPKIIGKGKSCVIPAGVQEKVMEYRKEGLSQQKIANLIQKTSGYMITRRQVQGIIDRLNK